MAGLLTMGIVTLVGVAHSADRPSLAVVGMHQAGLSEDDQVEVIRSLVQAAGATKQFDVLGMEDVALRIQGRERVIVEEGLLAGAIEKLKAGKGLYQQASPEGALLTLQTAVGELMRAMPATNRVTDLWEAWVYIGMCHLRVANPEPEAARVAFQNAAALMPERPLNDALFPPNVVETYEAERAGLAQFPVGLDITTDGAARVWVDGVERGPAPVRVDGLFPGEHYVVARGLGTLGYSIVTTNVPDTRLAPGPVRPSTWVDVPLSMRLPVLGQAADSRVGRSQQTGALYHALGNRSVDLDFVLLVGADADTLFLQLLDARTDALSRTLEVPYQDTASDEAIAALPELLALVDGQTRFTATSGAAAPLDVGANTQLAQLLLQPRDYAPPPPSAAKRRRRRVTAAVTTFLVAGAAAGGVAYFATQP